MADQASTTLESADPDVVDTPGPTTVDEVDAATVADIATDTVPGIATATDESLLGELARAMHQAATAQYERQNAELERRRTEQVEAIAQRADADVEELNAMSEAEIASIDAWAKAETEKVKQERLRRIEARRQRLATQLEHRASTREREVAAIEAAIDTHRQEVDGFFGRMERETDPTAIAKVAATMPAFPPLADIAESARARAAAEFAPLDGASTALEGDAEANVSESRLMAVMDPESTRPDSVVERPWEAPYAVSVAAGSGSAPTEPVATAPAAEHGSRVGSTLLRTVRAIRPVSGDRHEGDDRPA